MTMTEAETLDKLERYASTPDDRGRYPSDADCANYERESR